MANNAAAAAAASSSSSYSSNSVLNQSRRKRDRAPLQPLLLLQVDPLKLREDTQSVDLAGREIRVPKVDEEDKDVVVVRVPCAVPVGCVDDGWCRAVGFRV